MANFDKSLAITLKWEGGWALIANDKGAETYKGVSRANWPGWPGWAIIDKINGKRHNQYFDDPGLDCLVNSFYRLHFWNKVKGDDIQSQKVANILFDWAVLSGTASAAMNLQKCLLVSADGVIGPETLKATNRFNEASLTDCLVRARVALFNRIVENNPTQKKFLMGWLRRANSFT